MSVLLLLVGLVALALSYNALRPRFSPGGVAVVSFFAGWLVTELAFHVFAWEVFLVAALSYAGALRAWPGQLGALLTLVAGVMLIVSFRRSYASRSIVDVALADLAGDAVPPKWRVRDLLVPIPVRNGQVERLRDLAYYDDGQLRLRLDVFRRRGAAYSSTAKRPALLYVHGGAWVIGNKEHQGLPMLHRFAEHGWVCFSINYRLSPRATFPDHLVDVKRAIAWVKAHASEYGADPGFIVVSGGSAGGQLASLAALTPNRAALQPGFESADTTVQGCVSFYGVYDFTDRHGHWPNPALRRLLERQVFKVRFDQARERYEQASPIFHVGPQAPAFLVVHGELDSLVPVAEARAFVAALKEVSGQPVRYLEIPGAQHAFEVFPSVRTLHVLSGVERFLGWVWRKHRGEREDVQLQP